MSQCLDIAGNNGIRRLFKLRCWGVAPIQGFEVRGKLWPAFKAMLARQHQLSVGEREPA